MAGGDRQSPIETKMCLSNELNNGTPLPVSFVELRKRAWEEEPKVDPDVWRMRERMKTVSVALVLCLNVGVDPPDVVRPRPCARLECWMDPQNISQQKAIEIIGLALQKQYERWQPRARYKLSCDPTVEEIRKSCISLRKNAKDERVLFHYNGHGVPKPTKNGEIWVFNKMYTQYIPLSIFDLQSWMGTPGIYVWDCNGAGMAVKGFTSCARQHEKEYFAAKGQLKKLQGIIGDQSPSKQWRQHADSYGYYNSDRSAYTPSFKATARGKAHNIRKVSIPYGRGSSSPHLNEETTDERSCETLALVDQSIDNENDDEQDEGKPKFRSCIQLAACAADQELPTHPDLPADLFTCCLTTPIRTAVLWYILNNRLTRKLPLSIVDNIPGQLNDRRTPLGELNWIFTAVTDTIAWNSLPQDLFQRLFRQDLLVASLFRNFLLADRIMRSYKCTPISSPPLPPTHDHVMWEAWDHTLDVCLNQLTSLHTSQTDGKDFEKELLPSTAEYSTGSEGARSGYQNVLTTPCCNTLDYVHSDFFSNQLTAFEVWLCYGFHNRSPPQQLPILLQVLLSQVHRVRALELLSRFLDLGPWAVNLSLAVGIFPYVLRLLQSVAKELRPVLTFIWAKVLAVDNSCQFELVKDNAHLYFLRYMEDASVSLRQKVVPAFVLAALVQEFPEGQRALLQVRYMTVCSELLNDCSNALLRQWLVLGLSCLWSGFEEAKWLAVRCTLHEKIFELLSDPVSIVRASSAYALGCFMRNDHGSSDEQNTHLLHTIAMTMVSTLCGDGSALVRREALVAFHWFILKFENQFVTIVFELAEERRQTGDWTPLSDGHQQKCDSFANLGELAAAVDQLRRESSFAIACNVSSSSFVIKTPETPSPEATDGSTEANSAFSLRMNTRASVARLFGLVKQGQQSDWALSKSDTVPIPHHDRKQRSRDGTVRLSQVSNVYVTVWRAVLRFTTDPDSTVCQMANRLIGYVNDRVADLKRICVSSVLPTTPGSQGRRVTVVGSFPVTKSSSPVAEHRGSPVNRPKFSIGVGVTTVDCAGSPNEQSTYKSVSDVSPMLSIYSAIYTSLRRPVFGEGPEPNVGAYGIDRPDSGQPTFANAHKSSISPSSGCPLDDGQMRESRDGKSKPILETGFLSSCVQSFKLPVIDLLLSEESGSTTLPRTEQTLSSLRMDTLRATIDHCHEQWNALANKDQPYNNFFTCRNDNIPRSLQFFPADPMVCAGCSYTVSVWNWDTGALLAKFDNDSSMDENTIDQLAYLSLVNPFTHCFVLTGTDHGVVRVWDSQLIIDEDMLDPIDMLEKPNLLAAWIAVEPTCRFLEHPVTNYFWEQDPGLLYVGGDFRHLLVWDAHQERKVAELPVGAASDVYLSCLSSDTIGQHLTAAGCSDGSVRLFDRRLPSVECRIMTLRDLEAPVCKVHLEGAPSGSRLVAGTSRGQLCVWDPRLFQEPVTLCQIGDGDVTAIDIHPCLPMAAVGIGGSQVNVINFNGQTLASIRHHESFVGQKTGDLSCLTFHPMQVTLGIGESDCMFTVYSLNLAAP
ncbi:regulatory associated protein of mTOR [Trichuris trichiura]|uniref:Regulatory associated protein of mTOR n=1 Tax=Trichuris trichiura TaxID=36087 RepID=A0A077Z8X1_TRITR|nr:regulatory associated protein of mTOR [Trichuris trichiura]